MHKNQPFPFPPTLDHPERGDSQVEQSLESYYDDNGFPEVETMPAKRLFKCRMDRRSRHTKLSNIFVVFFYLEITKKSTQHTSYTTPKLATMNAHTMTLPTTKTTTAATTKTTVTATTYGHKSSSATTHQAAVATTTVLVTATTSSTSKSAYGTTTARTTIAMSTAAMLSSTTMKSTALLLAQQTTATATTQKKTHRVGHTIIKTASSEDNATKVGFPTRFL